MVWRVAAVSALAALVIAVGLFVRAQAFDAQDLAAAPAASALNTCLTSDDPVECSAQVLEQLPPERVSETIERAAGALLENTEVDCHSLLHTFGESAARAHGVGALVAGGSACSGGYYHGVLTGLGHEGEEVRSCDTLPGEDRLACWHGVGHLAVLSDDFSATRAAAQCQMATDLAATDLCLEGVAMEFVGVQPSSQTPQATLDVSLAMCEDLGVPDALGCIRQAFNQVATKSPSAVAERCRATSPEAAVECWEAVGAAVGGAYQPASRAASLALELCEDRDGCLERAVRAADDSRPSVGISTAICGVHPRLAACARA